MFNKWGSSVFIDTEQCKSCIKWKSMLQNTEYNTSLKIYQNTHRERSGSYTEILYW